MTRVAIIGAGPAGLCAARWLKKVGFDPVTFEQGERIGGHWSGDRRYSGVWSTMRANSSRITTAFSELSYPEGTPVFPSNREVLAYLERYVDTFELRGNLRLNSPVTRVERISDGAWRVTWGGSQPGEELFARVVVASGRYRRPAVPAIDGLDSFSGTGGVEHTFAYQGAQACIGMRTLVGGGGISALEIASDLALAGVATTTSQRRQRYILPSLLGGLPLENNTFTRLNFLAEESLPPKMVAYSFKELILRSAGSPDQVGAMRPPGTVAESGITQSQYFLSLVAEGRIRVKPWIARVDGSEVHFRDGSVEQFDKLILGTGFHLHFPFLSADLASALRLTEGNIELYKFTFHPDVEGLGFVGIVSQGGPYFPVLELQSRWIAYQWSGTQAALDPQEMRATLTKQQTDPAYTQDEFMHRVAIDLARSAGLEPNVADYPGLARALLVGPLSANTFRLVGPDQLGDANARIAQDAAAFGCVVTPEFNAREKYLIQAFAAARKDAALAALVPSASPAQA